MNLHLRGDVEQLYATHQKIALSLDGIAAIGRS
jgi:hypothetical protein